VFRSWIFWRLMLRFDKFIRRERFLEKRLGLGKDKKQYKLGVLEIKRWRDSGIIFGFSKFVIS
jgi:hypothetical protein